MKKYKNQNLNVKMSMNVSFALLCLSHGGISIASENVGDPFVPGNLLESCFFFWWNDE